MRNILRPISEPFSDEVAHLLSAFPQRDGYLIRLFLVFANSVRFLKKGTTNLLDRESPIPMRTREIIILRVTANNNCEYEWGVHVGAFSRHVGLTEEQVRATRLEPHDASCWPPEESLLIEAIDELCAEGKLKDETLVRYQEAWSVEQQLEIFALCGNYHTISFVANSAELSRESFAESFPG